MDEMKVIGYKVLEILGCMKIIFLLLPNFFVTECIPSIQSFVSLYSTKARVGKKSKRSNSPKKVTFDFRDAFFILAEHSGPVPLSGVSTEKC